MNKNLLKYIPPKYLYLLISYPIIDLYLRNYDQTTIDAFVFTFVALQLLMMFCWPFFSKIIKDRDKSGLSLSLWIILFLSYGHTHYFFAGKELEYSLQAHISISILWIILGSIGSYYIIKKVKTEKLSIFSKNLSFFLIILCAMPFLNSVFTNQPKKLPEGIQLPEKVDGDKISKLGYNPDIYFFILDGYARQDVLKKHYSFDNTPFLKSLEDMNFYNAKNSLSNYYKTFLSLSSSLNMQPINNLTKIYGKEGRGRRFPFKMIRYNKVANYLKKKGYNYIHVASTWGATAESPFSDRLIKCNDGVFTEAFLRVFYETTWLKVYSPAVPNDLASCWLYNMEKLEKIATRYQSAPKFVFAHFTPPHHPYLFDREGNILSDATVTNQPKLNISIWGKYDKYINQLVYINKRILKIVDNILKTSKNPPIIIIQSDHGSHLTTLDEDSFERHYARLSILSSYHLPEAKGLMPNDVTPINTFPIIFNYYFNSKIKIRGPKYYYSAHTRPYDFKEINLKYKSVESSKDL